MFVYNFKTFIHDLVVLTVFLFIAFSSSFCISSPEISKKLAAIFFENKSKNEIEFSVVMSTLLYSTIQLLLLYHYYMYMEIVMLTTNQIPEISRLIL